MAQIEIPPGGQIYEHGGYRFQVRQWPRCAGCGAEYRPRRDPLLSARGEPFGLDYRAYGTEAREVAAWAAGHGQCPNPRVEVTASGIVVTDRRRF